MARNRAKFYIEKLEEKGWASEDIQKCCNIRPPRMKTLRMPHAIPMRIEMKRLRAMMRKSTEKQLREVRKVWAEHLHPKTPATDHVPLELTDHQWGVMDRISDALERGRDGTTLSGPEALGARRLKSKGLVDVIEEETRSGTVRRYTLTANGRAQMKVK
jgi:hypothetical protein